MLTFSQSIILGVVEGLTEFLPISSTAHLILASHLLGVPQSDYVKSFEIVIQFGAILAVVCLYWRRFLELSTLKKLAAAFVPTGVIGMLGYPILKAYLLGNVTVVLCALAIGGALLILLERAFARRSSPDVEADPMRALTYRRAVALGAFQAIALIPGVSRSAATILGGTWMGMSRKAVVEFSFLLAVPTMAAATVLDLAKSAGSWNAAELDVLTVGFAVSFLTAFAAVRWLLKYVQKHDFVAFGVYRLILVVIFLAFWI